ncbi:hypothetical protein COU13_00850 [Candidatus Kaiserbacteria bacterium CG10_big_fil_rev_8_21_14_0_10_43_70]|uniref:Uncharacterized protein n=1 Tax=Candidatus Kaiserbacteria bacterium CG10_big_fil_rev_8_21_14_0_10_43_70 TaxID=1974605 RepID=A0A2H0UJ75_9BACT|nr:MAG: hypothetical protein COU13_00850 [Candidatus Kaiserbacteria bacterium CG10_big_fil_rev_8_21_14_0_10_43_70]
MKATVKRISWFAVFATILAFSSHLFFGSVFASSDSPIKEIVIRDTFNSEKESHDIHGRIFIPSECHDVTVQVRDFDSDTVVIIIETWEQPYRECPDTAKLHPFQVSFFAPEKIKIRTLVDEKFYPTRVLVEEQA